MLNILSIDGGGMRGYITALIGDQLEADTGKDLHTMFDLVAGTSTGGILTAAICLGIPCGNIVSLYEKHGPAIFKREWWRVLGPKYTGEALHRALVGAFGDATMGEAKTHCMVTSYNLTRKRPHFFKSWKHPERSMVYVAKASSAAPTYFPPVQDPDSGDAMIDGGICINNPELSALASGIRKWGLDRVRLFSLGAGGDGDGIPWEKCHRWGKVRWIVPVIAAMMDGQSDVADYQGREILGRSHRRLQVPCGLEMDDTTKMPQMRALARTAIKSDKYEDILGALK